MGASTGISPPDAAYEALQRLSRGETWRKLLSRFSHDPDLLASQAGRVHAALAGMGEEHSEAAVAEALVRWGGGPEVSEPVNEDVAESSPQYPDHRGRILAAIEEGDVDVSTIGGGIAELAASCSTVASALQKYASRPEPDEESLVKLSQYIGARLSEKGYSPEPRGLTDEVWHAMRLIHGSSPAFPGLAWDAEWAHGIARQSLALVEEAAWGLSLSPGEYARLISLEHEMDLAARTEERRGYRLAARRHVLAGRELVAGFRKAKH